MSKINTTMTLTDEFTNPMQRIVASMQNAKNTMAGLGGDAMQTYAKMGIFQNIVGVFAKVGGAVKSVAQSFISEAGDVQMLTSRLTTMFQGNYEMAEEMLGKIQKFASATPFDVKGTTDGVIMLKNAGFALDNLFPAMRMLGDLSQGDNQAFKSMVYNLMQIRASGKATEMDLKQFATYGVNIKEGLKSIGKEGSKSFEDIMDAIVAMTSEGGTFYNSMANGTRTLQGRAAALGDTLAQLKTQIGKTMLPVVQKVQGVLATFFDNLKYMFSSVKEWGEPMTQFFERLYQYIPTAIALLLDLATVATLVGTVIGVMWAVANWPVTLIIVGLSVLVATFVDVQTEANNSAVAVQGFGNAVANSAQLLFSVVTGIGSAVRNIFVIIYNVFNTCCNALAMIAEFLINVFSHPVVAIQTLFINLLHTILGVITTVAGAIDTIIGKNLSGKLNEWDAKLVEMKKNAIANQGSQGLAYQEATYRYKTNTGVISDAKNAGQLGNEIGMVVDKSLAGLSINPEGGGFDDILNQKYNKALENLDTDASGNLKVTDQALLNLVDDWKDLLSTKATERFNLHFASITPQVSIENMNVSKTADVDEVIEAIADGVEDASGSSLRS